MLELLGLLVYFFSNYVKKGSIAWVVGRKSDCTVWTYFSFWFPQMKELHALSFGALCYPHEKVSPVPCLGLHVLRREFCVCGRREGLWLLGKSMRRL